MPVERLDLGAAPRLVVSTQGDLEVRGVARSDTRIESDSPALKIEPGEGGARVESPGGCLIRMPEAGSVDATSVLGSLRIRDLSGTVAAGEVGGACFARRLPALAIRQVRGDARIRDIAGPVEIEQVGGCLTLRDIAGPVRVGSVSADFMGRDLRAEAEIGPVLGNLALRTSFKPGSVSRFHATGEAVFRLPPGASVRFVLPAECELKLDRGLGAVAEGSSQILTLGDGAATVHVDGASHVTIRQRGDLDEEAAFAYTFAVGDELNDYFADLSAELETQFSVLEENLSGSVSERVRSQIEKRLNSARRQVEAAQRHVEREVQRTQRGPGIAINIGPEMARGQAISEQERLMVLQMLEDGKISVEQAEALLAALEGKD